MLQLPPNRLSDALGHSRDLAESLHKYMIQQLSQGVQLPTAVAAVVAKAVQEPTAVGEEMEDDGVKQ